MFRSDVDVASTQCFEIKPHSKRVGFFICNCIYYRMKYLITESQREKVIFKYLDNQDFIQKDYGEYTFFVNSKEDLYAQIKYNPIRGWITISRDLMKEISSFFSLDNNDSISAIAHWVENKIGAEYTMVDVQSDIVIYYYK